MDDRWYSLPSLVPVPREWLDVCRLLLDTPNASAEEKVAGLRGFLRVSEGAGPVPPKSDPLGYRSTSPAEIDNSVHPGAWKERGRSAGLVIQLIPIGQPGQIRLKVDNLGSEALSRAEAVRVLRGVADQLEEGES